MDAKLESQGGEETGVIVDVPEAVEMMSQGGMYRIALNLPTGMKAGPYRLVRKDGEGPVVHIYEPAGCVFARCDPHCDFDAGKCKWAMWDSSKIRRVPGPDCPGAGRYRLVRVADVEVGDAR